MNRTETPQHQTQSAELYQAVLEEDAQLRMVDAHSPVGIMDTVEQKIDHHLAKHDVKRAERAAKKDYRQNMGAYQDEALHDAIADGVDVNVPEPDTRIKYPSVAERVAYEGKKNMDTAVELQDKLIEREAKLGEFLVKGWDSAADASQQLVDVTKQRIAQEEAHAEQNWEWAEEDEAAKSAKRKAQRQARSQKAKA